MSFSPATLPLKHREQIAADIRRDDPPGEKRVSRIRSLGLVPLPEDGHAKPAAPSKFGNVRTENEAGEKFDSKLERTVYERLVARFGIKNVMRQVSLVLPGGVRMKPDFLVIHERFDDGTVRVGLLDAKGHATRDWLNKAKVMREWFGWPVRVVKSAGEVAG